METKEIILTGKATESGTKSYAEVFNGIQYNLLGATNFTVSPAGFGGYRVDVEDFKAEKALKKALSSGINIIDTSSNYANGKSERLVGKVLRKLSDEGKISRESVVLVSKGGYIQGDAFKYSLQRKQDGKPFEDLVEYAPGLDHCIHPEFLELQIACSLERLGVDTIDVYLLHNPEYYLNWLANMGKIDDKALVDDYYRRIKDAFEYLEKEVERGRIQYYGVSSNSFPENMDSVDFTSLEKLIKIADKISENNHFKVIQFPMNILEYHAATEVNQSEDRTLLELAEEKDIGVMINRPLNAMLLDSKLIRLADLEITDDVNEDMIESKMTKLIKLENRIKNTDFIKKSEDYSIVSITSEEIFFSDKIANNWKDFAGLEHCKMAISQYFVPRLIHCKSMTAEKINLPEEILHPLEDYISIANSLLKDIITYYEIKHALMVQDIKIKLLELDPSLFRAETLSQKTVRALRATKGVSTVLVGMHQAKYVDDILAELNSYIDIKNDRDYWERFNILSSVIIK